MVFTKNDQIQIKKILEIIRMLKSRNANCEEFIHTLNTYTCTPSHT